LDDGFAVQGMINFTIDKTSPIPYYYQIEEWLREMISSRRSSRRYAGR
jgi:hypothetical protein